MSVIGAHPRSVCRSPGVCAPAREGRGGNVCGAPPIVRPALLPRRPGVWAVRPSLTGHAAPATLPTSKRPPGCGRSARRVGPVALADNDRGGGHVTERHGVSLPRKGVLGLRFVHMLATVGGGPGGARMRVTTVSAEADRGRSNEDFVGAVPTAAVVVDGAHVPGAEGVCRHGVAWYAHRLGAGLLALLGAAGDETLPELLAAAIEQVTDEHRHTCDPAHPRSPWAAVALVRVRNGWVEHLVLGD